MNIVEVLKSGSVKRFHSVYAVSSQTIADHSWGVALIVQHIAPDCSKEVLLFALTHDCAEVETGDVPFPIKKRNRELVDLLEYEEDTWNEINGVKFDIPHEQYRIVKLADCLDGMWTCLTKYKRGEQEASRPFWKWNDFIIQNMGDLLTGNAYDLFEYLRQEIDKCKIGS